jgi:hypothetical protein
LKLKHIEQTSYQRTLLVARKNDFSAVIIKTATGTATGMEKMGAIIEEERENRDDLKVGREDIREWTMACPLAQLRGN